MAKWCRAGSNTTTRIWCGSPATASLISLSSSTTSCTSWRTVASASDLRRSSFAQSDFVPQMIEIARQAGALLMEHFHRRVTVEYKGEADLVTIADRQSE